MLEWQQWNSEEFENVLYHIGDGLWFLYMLKLLIVSIDQVSLKWLYLRLSRGHPKDAQSMKSFLGLCQKVTDQDFNYQWWLIISCSWLFFHQAQVFTEDFHTLWSLDDWASALSQRIWASQPDVLKNRFDFFISQLLVLKSWHRMFDWLLFSIYFAFKLLFLLIVVWFVLLRHVTHQQGQKIGTLLLLIQENS